MIDTLEVLFRPLPLDQTGFGLSEALAHLRHLVGRGEPDQGLDGKRWAFVRRQTTTRTISGRWAPRSKDTRERP